jgi:cytochrome c biogenesis protein CcmG, thiol:disulfide interchange protein DsbE
VAVRRHIVPILVSLAGACLVGLLVYGVSARSANHTLDDLVTHHDRPRAPDASRLLPILGGHGESSLAAERGKVVVLNLWASWCQPCKAEAPLLQRAQAQLLREHATVLGVTSQDAAPDSEAFVRRYGVTYPNLRDADGGFARAYGTNELPESFIVDREGRVVAISRGEIDQAFLQRAIMLGRRS